MLLPALSLGQALSEDAKTSTTNSTDQVQIGGETAMDLIQLDGNSPQIPLRNGGILPGTEEVELGDRKLTKGKEYAIDYASGTLVLMVTTKPGQALRVRYRFDKSRAKTGISAASAFSRTSFNFGKGSGASISLGMLERSPDGAMTRSNLYSLRSNFSSGTISTNGVFAVSQIEQLKSASLFDGSQGKEKLSGTGRAIVQRLAQKTGSSEFYVDYQDIGEKFSGASSFTDAGYSVQQAEALQRERGLKRMGFGANNVKLGVTKASFNIRNVDAKSGGIAWSSFNLGDSKNGISYTARKVDQDFNRFADLNEQERDLLAREKGLTTKNFGLNLASKGYLFELQTKSISNLSSQSFERQSIRFEGKNFKVSGSTQSVDQGFQQFQGIREQNAEQIRRETGMDRKQWAINFGAISSQIKSVDFNFSEILKQGRSNVNTQVKIEGRGLQFERSQRGGLLSGNDLRAVAEPEVQQGLQQIANYYGAAAGQVQGWERDNWFNSSLIRRESTALNLNGKNNFAGRLVKLTGASSSAELLQLNSDFGGVKFGYRNLNIGSNFTEVGSLLQFEKNIFGNVSGMQKQDFSLSTKLGKSSELIAETMNANLGNQGASRLNVSYNDPRMALRYTTRNVDQDFWQVGQLIDPERQHLEQMRGQVQRQIQLNWLLMRDLRLQLDWTDNEAKETGIESLIHQSSLSFKPNAKSEVNWFQYQQFSPNEIGELDKISINRFGLSQAIAKFGTIGFENETQDYDNVANTPDNVRNTIIVEAQLNPKTGVRTEQSNTTFSSGESEQVQSHTVSTSVTKNTGISVTDTHITRSGPKPDERKRNYGFWVDLGGGVRFSYGYARELNEAADGIYNSTVGLTAGQTGGFQFGQAGYQQQRWDGTRNRSLGNFQVSTMKPIQLGPLRNFAFNISTDTVRDHDLWQRESQILNLSAKLFGLQTGFDYLSQYDVNLRARGIDRTFKLSTGKNPKQVLGAEMTYKIRTMPNGQTYDIRNLEFTSRLIPGTEIKHNLQTYPEIPRGDLILGTLAQPFRSSKWQFALLDQKAVPWTIEWEERANDQAKQISRTARMNLTLFAKSPSPLFLSYGLEHNNQNGTKRTLNRYSLRFDQRPGPNQRMSFALGNDAWTYGRLAGQNRDQWSMRMEYQVRW